MAKKKFNPYEQARLRLKAQGRASRVAQAMSEMRNFQQYGSSSGPSPMQEAQEQLRDEQKQRMEDLRDQEVQRLVRREKYGKTGSTVYELFKGAGMEEFARTAMDRGLAKGRAGSMGSVAASSLMDFSQAGFAAGMAPFSISRAVMTGALHGNAGQAGLAAAGQSAGKIGGYAGSGVGGLLGGAIGALTPIPGGAMIGGAIGSTAGGMLGSTIGTPLSLAGQGVGIAQQLVDQLGMFHGGTAAAVGQARATDIMGDVRRANLLGPEMADFVKAQSQLGQTGKDLMADLMKPLIPLLSETLKLLKEFVEWARPYLLKALGLLLEQVEGVLTWINDRYQTETITRLLEKIHKGIDAIQKNTSPKLDGKTPLDDLMEMRAPGRELTADMIERNRAGMDKNPMEPGRLLPAFALP